MLLLSANGTLRTILILLILWQLLRMWMRVQANARGGGQGSNWSAPDNRPKGEVRIERTDDPRTARQQGRVEDADFEEIK
jgi:hypothetical protein